MADILVVDDDPDVADAIAELLTEEGHQVRVAHDGAEGLACLAARMADLILLDVDMPRLSGTQMAYQVLVMDAGREKIPVVLLSATPDLSRIAATIGTRYFLSTPCKADDLLRLIARARELS